MRYKRYEPIIMSGLFLCVAAIYASQIPYIKISNFVSIDSAFFPKLILSGLVVLALVQLVFGIIEIRKSKAEANVIKPSKIDFLCVFETLALSAIYVATLSSLGFLIATIIYLFFQMSVLCPKEEYKPVLFLVISLISSAAIYIIFRYGLRLMLPQGLLRGIF